MIIRRYEQIVEDDMGKSGTKTYDLDVTEPITELLINIGATNGATYNKASPIESCISKIELVDGGTVLWDLPGDVAFGSVAHLKNALPHCYRTEAGGDNPYVSIPIQFGRFYGDTRFAFNPIAHKNPQLKVTFDEATINAAGATGFVSDSFLFSLLVNVMQEAPSPTGFLACREVESFTSLGSGDRRVSMPTDRVMRALVFRVYEDGTDIRDTIKHYKLSADAGKMVPLDITSGRFIDVVSEQFKSLVVPVNAVGSNDETIPTWMGIDLTGQLTARASGIIVGADAFWPGRVFLRAITHAGAAQSNTGVFVETEGWGVQYTLVYPFGDMNDPDQWFNAPGYRNLDLYLTQGNPGADVNVCVQQMYGY